MTFRSPSLRASFLIPLAVLSALALQSADVGALPENRFHTVYFDGEQRYNGANIVGERSVDCDGSHPFWWGNYSEWGVRESEGCSGGSPVGGPETQCVACAGGSCYPISC